MLGGARLEVGGEPLQGRAAHRRRIAVLALLAAAPAGSLGREKIVGYLWPDAEPDAARRVLSEAVYVIRKELGDGVLVSAGDELVLDASLVGSDIADFRRAMAAGDLEAAVAVYAGPFLDGWYVPDAVDFERWAEAERERLAREYAGALTALAERDEAGAHWDAAIPRWRQLARVDRYNSRHVLRLARALAAHGERAAAVQAIEAHEELLRADLEVPLPAELTALAASLRVAPGVVAPLDLPVPVPAPISQAPAPPRASPSASPARIATRRLRTASTSAIVVLALLAGGVAAWYARPSTSESHADDASLDPNRVAVLFLEDHSRDHHLGQIAADLTTSLIDELSGVNVFRVVSRNGVAQFRNTSVPVDTIASRLGAGTIVEGSVQESGGQLQVIVQVADARTHTVAESRRVIGSAAGLFALEREVTERVADALRTRLGQEVRLREVNAGSTSEIARKLIVLGRRERDDAASLAARPDPVDVQTAMQALTRAESLFARAHEEDPKWIRPLVERAWTVRDMANLRQADDRIPVLRRALGFAEQAVALDPASAVAHEVRGTVHWGLLVTLAQGTRDSVELSRAERDLRYAVDTDSTLATAWGTLSLVLSARGAFAEAQLAAQRALREDAYLDGASDIAFQLYASSVMLGDLHAAREACLDAQRAYPGDWRFVECELTLLRNDTSRAPDPTRAWALVDRLSVLDPPDKAAAAGHAFAPIFRRIVAAAVSARAGQTRVAREEIARARRATAGDSALRLDLAYGEAYVHLLLGERTQAVMLLRGLIAARPVLRARVLRDRLLQSISADVATP